MCSGAGRDFRVLLLLRGRQLPMARGLPGKACLHAVENVFPEVCPDPTSVNPPKVALWLRRNAQRIMIVGASCVVRAA